MGEVQSGSERWSLDAAIMPFIMDKSRHLGAYERRGDGYMAYLAVRQALRPQLSCLPGDSLLDGFREDQKLKYGTTEDR